MSPEDVYDDRPEGAVQRRYTARRLGEPEREEAARRARIAQVIALEELWHEVVHAHSTCGH